MHMSHVYMHIFMHIYMETNRSYVHAFTYVHGASIYIYTRMYMLTYVYVYIYIYIYTHVIITVGPPPQVTHHMNHHINILSYAK